MAAPREASASRKKGSAAAVERTKTMTEHTAQTAAADYAAKASEMLKDLSAKAKTAFEKSGEVSKDVAEFHKANLEAVVESGKLAAKSLQDVAQHGADIGKKQWEAASAHAKTLAAVTSPTDFMAAQTEFLRGQFDAVVADFSKTTEFYMKLAGEIAQPVQNRYAAAAEQVKARFAA
jgi:phasin family protein